MAVVLSAQCTDKKVNEITPLLFAQARTPQQMVKLSVEEDPGHHPAMWALPHEEQGIHGLSRIILEEHGGEVPANMAALNVSARRGPQDRKRGDGASLRDAGLPVDTHIHRLAWRWGLSTGKSVEHRPT